MHRLISLPFSHYVEKARWSLDRAGIAYREERYMPMFSSAAVAWATRGRGGEADRVSTRFSSPTLLLDDGRVLTSSTDIAHHADALGQLGWYDDPEALELETWFHDKLGPHTRRVAYRIAFANRAVLAELAQRNVSRRQALAFTVLNPLVERSIVRGLGVDEARAAKSLGYVRAELDKVGDRLGDGRPYLLGERFSGADSTFACMMAPAVLPSRAEGFGADLPTLDVLPAEARDLVAEVRGHPAGRFVLRLFAEERTRAVQG